MEHKQRTTSNRNGKELRQKKSMRTIKKEQLLTEFEPIKIVYLKDKNRPTAVLICSHCGHSMPGAWKCLWTEDKAGRTHNVNFIHYKCQDEFEAVNAERGLWFSRGWPALGYITWPTDEELSKVKPPAKCVYVVMDQFGKVIAITKSYLRAYRRQISFGEIRIFSVKWLEDGGLKDDPYVEKWLKRRNQRIRERRR